MPGAPAQHRAHARKRSAAVPRVHEPSTPDLARDGRWAFSQAVARVSSGSATFYTVDRTARVLLVHMVGHRRDIYDIFWDDVT